MTLKIKQQKHVVLEASLVYALKYIANRKYIPYTWVLESILSQAIHQAWPEAEKYIPEALSTQYQALLNKSYVNLKIENLHGDELADPDPQIGWADEDSEA